MDLQNASLSEIAFYIRRNWKKVSPYAEPYLAAMETLHSINENYYLDSGRSVVAYFISNATGWRGDVARSVKVELHNRINGVH